jgi:cysteine desulfuration protein SufE
MTFREKQNEIIETLNSLPDWYSRYNYILDIGRDSPPMPEHLKIQANRIGSCISRTYFFVEKRISAESGREELLIHGWSNSTTPAGFIALLKQLCDGFSPAEIPPLEIDFHYKTGLLDSLSPTRKAGLIEMISKIY